MSSTQPAGKVRIGRQERSHANPYGIKIFFSKLTENYDLSIGFECLEKTIISSLDNKVVINDLTLKGQVNKFANIPLGFNDK